MTLIASIEKYRFRTKFQMAMISLRIECSPDIFIRNSSDALWYIIHSNLIQNIKWPKTKLLLLSYTNDLFYIVKYYLPFKWIIFKNAKKYLNSHFLSFKSYRFFQLRWVGTSNSHKTKVIKSRSMTKMHI